MRMVRKFLLLLSVLLCLQIPGLAEEKGAVPEAWGITFETDDVAAAARLACLTYDGIGYWDDAAFQTVGIHVFSQEEDGDTITLKLYSAHSVYQILDGMPNEVSGGSNPVLLAFRRQGNALVLTQYRTAGDGSERWDNVCDMFGETLAYDALKNSEQYAAMARRDALQIAQQYILADADEKLSLPCIAFLPSGSNPAAADIVHSSVSGWFPSHAGKWISEEYSTMFSLTVEGEESYSGILTYESFNPAGERLAYVKVQVEGETLNILDGTLPSMVE